MSASTYRGKVNFEEQTLYYLKGKICLVKLKKN
jgi:hypothetical protein